MAKPAATMISIASVPCKTQAVFSLLPMVASNAWSRPLGYLDSKDLGNDLQRPRPTAAIESEPPGTGTAAKATNPTNWRHRSQPPAGPEAEMRPRGRISLEMKGRRLPPPALFPLAASAGCGWSGFERAAYNSTAATNAETSRLGCAGGASRSRLLCRATCMAMLARMKPAANHPTKYMPTPPTRNAILDRGAAGLLPENPDRHVGLLYGLRFDALIGEAGRHRRHPTDQAG